MEVRQFSRKSRKPGNTGFNTKCPSEDSGKTFCSPIFLMILALQKGLKLVDAIELTYGLNLDYFIMRS